MWKVPHHHAVDASLYQRGIAQAKEYLQKCVAVSPEVSDVGSLDEEDEDIRRAEQTDFLVAWYQELWEKVLGALSVYFRVAPFATDKHGLFRMVSQLNHRSAYFLDIALNELDIAQEGQEKDLWRDLKMIQ